jgi:hypothetical protein
LVFRLPAAFRGTAGIRRDVPYQSLIKAWLAEKAEKV